MTQPMLRIAAQQDSVFIDAIRAAGHEPVILPRLPDEHHNRSILQRIEDGKIYTEFFESNPIDLLLDIETSAMTFVPDPATQGAYAMTHTRFGVPYVSHYIDPVTETMQQVDWSIRWRALENPGWIKWVWDAAHAGELTRLGVTNVLSMPLATVNGRYPTDPLPQSPAGPPVGFAGHPATPWFCSDAAVQPASLRNGMIAAACNADAEKLTFHEIFYDLYQMADPPRVDEPPIDRAKKAADYFNAKFVYNAYLALKQRDRFAVFLKRRLGEQFELIGDDWTRCHGIPHKPRVTGRDALIDAYRGVAICLNLIKGNAETGLNLRHFEITAAGGFMLTYKIGELADCFEVGTECAVFENEVDLLDKIRYYLAHPKERIEIALAGQRRTLNEHLYSHRLKRLIERIRTSAGRTLVEGKRKESVVDAVTQ
ncbi:MAG: glycosyltransferase family 1 protein [Planctomycetes bacterium]|nr:glycosyltransferase family 1 protein [Planctomycetota bacterium]